MEQKDLTVWYKTYRIEIGLNEEWKSLKRIFVLLMFLIVFVGCLVTAVFADATQPADSQTTTIDQNTRQIVQTYRILDGDPTPEDIPQTFDEDGFRYTLADSDSSAIYGDDAQEVSVEKSMSSSSKPKISDFGETLDYDQDGYTGVLNRDDETFTVTASGTKNVSKTVTSTQLYTGLPRNDMSVIAKSKDGLPLVSVDWTDSATGQPVKGFTAGTPGPYSALAHYVGKRTSTVSTGYAGKVTYTGTVSKKFVAGTELAVTYTGSLIPQQQPTSPSSPVPVSTLVTAVLGIAAVGGVFWWMKNKYKKQGAKP